MSKLQSLSTDDYVKVREKLVEKAKSKADLSHNEWLSVRDAAKQLKLTQDDIIDLAEDAEHLDLIVGFRTYSGIVVHKKQGDYKIEYYE